MRANGVWLSRAKTENDKSLLFSANAVMASIRALNYDRENRADIAQKEAAADEMREKIKHYDALIDRINFLSPAEKEQLLAQADKCRADSRKVGYEADRQKLKLDWEQKMKANPIELFTSWPGLTTFISKTATELLQDAAGTAADVVQSLLDGANGSTSSYPDPVRDFVKKNWNKLVDYAYELDKKYIKNPKKLDYMK